MPLIRNLLRVSTRRDPFFLSQSMYSRVLRKNYHASALMAAAKRDLYEVLGVRKDASKSDIKKAYFALAKKYHPDVNKDEGADKKFKEAAEAYDILEKDDKRQMYDQYGHDGVSDDGAGGFQGNPFAQGFGGFGGQWGPAQGQEDIFSMFEHAFGGNSRAGKDVQAGMQITFFEAVSGCKRDLEFEYVESTVKNGRVHRARKSKKVSIDIPPGVSNGVTLRMSRNGAPGSDGSVGDLYIEIGVKEDPYFKRQGQDIHVKVPITVSQAILGGTVDVLTLDGMIEMKVPAGVQPGGKVVLREKGMADLNRRSNKRGNQYVQFDIEIPTKLTDRQKELITEFQEDVVKVGEASKSSNKLPFSIEEAWKRVKTFLGKDCKDDKKGKKANC